MNGYREDHERYHKHGPSTDDEPRLSIEELGRAVHEGGFDLLAATIDAMLPELPPLGGLPHRYNPRPGDTWCRTCNSAPGEFPHDDICTDCAFEDGSSTDRRQCSNCDREFPNA